jgi:phosphatidylinositol alpha-1,6-mannosyltransferase
MKKNRILFLNLATFHFTGGIEKVNRCIYKALDEESISNPNFDFRAISVYDSNQEFQSRYANPQKVFNFNQSKLKSSICALWQAIFADTILLSHINLAPVAFLIKTLFPNKKLVIMAHGIEIWGDISGIQKKAIHKADKIIAVSNFTKAEVAKKHIINLDKIVVCNNGLDPFMELPTNFDKPQELLTRYNLTKEDFVLFTLTRLSSNEQYKGYDKVFEAMAQLVNEKPNLKYLIGGKGDAIEIERISNLIRDYRLENNVQLLGFINEDELANHFLVADTYIMPSQNEGFGIVFIEAAFYGLPIVAGNMDGSIDALLNGQFGLLVNPININEIKKAILEAKVNLRKFDISNQLNANFGFSIFKLNFFNAII